jgi:hypothetical protein
MLIPNKFSGYSFDGTRKAYFGGKGGGGGSSPPPAAPSSQTVTNTSIPEYARPYVETLLGQSEALTDINQNPYKKYGDQRIADFSPLQQQAFKDVENQTVASQLAPATNLATASGLGSIDISGRMAGVGQDYARQATDPGSVQAYMSPYIQSALQPQLLEMNRQYDATANRMRGQAAGAGAFGGSRAAIQQAENQRNKNMGMNAAIGQGYQDAFKAAQQAQQFGANLGLQGYQGALSGLAQANTAAGTLGQLGQTEFGQEQAILGEKQKVGAIQQGQAQQGLDLSYQDFIKQKNYPYQQLAFMSDMLRGLPLSQQSQSIYSAPPSVGSQLGGLGMTALGIYGASGGFKAKGGMVGKGYAEGGQVGYARGGNVSMLSTAQLMKLLESKTLNPLERAEVEQQLMLRQRMENNPESMRMLSGIAAIPTGDMIPEGMAGGGIVAFADNPDQPVREGMPGRTLTEEDRLFLEQNPYMRRSRAVAELGGSLRDAFTNPSNYNPIDLYNRNIGRPFAEAVDRFKNADLTSTFRTGQKARTGEIPMFSGTELTPKGRMVAEGRMKPEENVLNVIKREREQQALNKDFENFDKATALFEQEQKAKLASKSGNVSTKPSTKPKTEPVKAKTDDKAVPAEVKGTPEEPLYAKYEKMLMDEREAAKANKEQAMYTRLIEAGLGIMGGTSQYAAENIGKGATPALKGYGEDVKGARAEERGRIKDLLGIEGMRQEAQRSAKEMAFKEKSLEQDKELKTQMLEVQRIAALKPNQTEQIIALGQRAGLNDREIMSQIIGSAKDPDTSARNILMKSYFESPILQAKHKTLDDFLKSQGIGAGATAKAPLNYVPGKGIQ